jgi:DNA polymerase-3 subunit beta
MKFKAERAVLLKALAHVQSVVEKRNTIPILANLMMGVKDGALTLTATDMEIAIVEQVAATATQPGAATAPAATLYEIVRKLPEGAEVELNHPGGDAPLGLRAGRYTTSLMVLPVDDFPSMTAGTLPYSFRLSAQLLRGMIDRTRFAISTEETRYYLNGIYLHTAMGADGVRVLRASRCPKARRKSPASSSRARRWRKPGSCWTRARTISKSRSPIRASSSRWGACG